jgi:hypothetical protein
MSFHRWLIVVTPQQEQDHPGVGRCLGQKRDAPRARFALRSRAGGEQPPLLRPVVKPAEAHGHEDDKLNQKKHEGPFLC